MKRVKLFALISLLFIGLGHAWGETTISYGWEDALDANVWEQSNLSNGKTYSTYKKSGSYAASTGSTTSAYIKTKEKIASPKSATCYYTKASSNTNSSSKFIIQVSTDGSAWMDVATSKTMNNVTQGTFYELTADLSSYSDVYIRFYYTGTNAARVIDDVSIISSGSVTYTDDFFQQAGTQTTPTCRGKRNRYVPPAYPNKSHLHLHETPINSLQDNALMVLYTGF